MITARSVNFSCAIERVEATHMPFQRCSVGMGSLDSNCQILVSAAETCQAWDCASNVLGSQRINMGELPHLEASSLGSREGRAVQLGLEGGQDRHLASVGALLGVCRAGGLGGDAGTCSQNCAGLGHGEGRQAAVVADDHLAEVELSIVEVVAHDGGTLVDNHVVTNGDQLEVAHVQRINVASLPNAGSLRRITHELALHAQQLICKLFTHGSGGLLKETKGWSGESAREIGVRTRALYHQVRKGVPRKCSANTAVVTWTRRDTCGR